MESYSVLMSVYHKADPIFFDADEWCDLAVEAGMKYIVITSKHHEGFALFNSEADPFNVVDATPFKRDIIKELEGYTLESEELSLEFEEGTVAATQPVLFNAATGKFEVVKAGTMKAIISEEDGDTHTYNFTLYSTIF